MKKFIYRRFLNKMMNIALILSCLSIVFVQLYMIFMDVLLNSLSKVIDYIGERELLVALLCGGLPMIPSFVGALVHKNKIVKKRDARTNCKTSKTEIFPGAITNDMIDNKEVILVSERSLKNVNCKKPMILDRSEQCKTICKKISKIHPQKKCLNCLFLTGTSGAGKSIFLKHFLKKKFKSSCNKIKCKYFKEYDTACDLIYQDIVKSKAEYVILDQFETSLQYTQIYSYIRKIIKKSNYGITFIFSFPQDYFDQISLCIDKYVLNGKDEGKIKDNTCTYFLGCDKHDIEQLKVLVNTFLKTGLEVVDECLELCETNFVHSGTFMPVLGLGRYPTSLVFLCSVLTRIKTGKSPLVEFSTISYIYELYKEDIDYNIQNYIDNLDKIFELYFNNWLEDFRNKETGMIVLQMISDGEKYNFDDLKCITFEKKEFFETSTNDNDRKMKKYNIMPILENNKFIVCEKNYEGFRTGIWVVHDYIANKINEFCFKHLDNNIRQNVEYYRKGMVNRNQSNSIHSESNMKLIILGRYKHFYTKKNKYFVDFLVVLLMIASIFVSCIKGGDCDNKINNVYYIFIALGCFFSTYYMYNVVMMFLRILDKKYYYPVSIFGTALIILCYVFPDYWGIFSGIEIAILGGSLFSIRKITSNLAIAFFREKGIFYIVLGVVVVIFGGVYCFCTNRELRITLSLFYLFYVIASNYAHINYTYIINKIGMGNTI